MYVIRRSRLAVTFILRRHESEMVTVRMHNPLTALGPININIFIVYLRPDMYVNASNMTQLNSLLLPVTGASIWMEFSFLFDNKKLLIPHSLSDLMKQKDCSSSFTNLVSN